MRRHVMTGAVLAALFSSGTAVALAQADSGRPAAPPTTIPSDTGAAPTTTVPVATETTVAAAVVPARIYDVSGNAVATVTVTGVELAWTDYEADDEPAVGRQYVRMTVTVESLIAGWHYDLALDDFILQDNNGFVTTADAVPTLAQADADEEIIEEADLAINGIVELTLTFEVDANVGPQAVFYRPDDDRLVQVAVVG